MDIIIEGQITSQEGMDEVLQTVLDLKNVAHSILRITSTADDVKGRIAFSGNGYIVGGKLDSGPTGYPAVRTLLSVKEGNYAILDPGRTHVAETNQTLWINAEKLKESLHNLPENAESLVDGDASRITNSEKLKTGHINLRTKQWKDEAEPSAVAEVGSKSRKFDKNTWRFMRRLFVGLVVLCIVLFILDNTDKFLPQLYSLLPFLKK